MLTITPSKTILYHDACFDGTGAAWALYQKFHHDPGSEMDQYLPADYAKPIPWEAIDGQSVYIVDFSYPTEVMKAIIERASSVVMLDHHARSETILAEVEAYVKGHENPMLTDRVEIQYCATKSGALMAWEWAFPSIEPPMAIRYISDRDLWQFTLPGTKAFMAALGTYPLKLVTWIQLFAEHGHNGYGLEAYFQRPEMASVVAQRIRSMDIDWAMEYTLRAVTIQWIEEDGSHQWAKVPLLNCPPAITSEALAQLVPDYLFAVAYFDMPEGRRFSLRSKDYNVRHVARHYGGDGHAKAAGFTVPRDHPLAHL